MVQTEPELIAKRYYLWQHLQKQVIPSDERLAAALGMSRAWVQKWRRRLANCTADALTAFMRRPRPPRSDRKVPQALVARILALREQLSEHYGRTVGARNILYHLQREAPLSEFVPRSATTIHRVLVEQGYVRRTAKHCHTPRELSAPLTVIEMDYTDVNSAREVDSPKRAHQVEVLNFVDAGSSAVLAMQVGTRCDAEQSLRGVAAFFAQQGCPPQLRFDRDPRFIGAQNAFPSALLRFLYAVGVVPDLCPPRRPDRKPYVERFIRSQKAECLAAKRPATAEEAQAMLDAYRDFYNHQRPNQARACQNRPPWTVIADLPPLPPPPQQLDPDAWLTAYDGQTFLLRVNRRGRVRLDGQFYSIGRQHAERQVLFKLVARERVFEVCVGGQVIKRLPIKGLVGRWLTWEACVEHMALQARSEARVQALKGLRYTT